MRRVLILGGTTEARHLAERLAGRTDLAVTVSLAGRTTAPAAQAAPVRIGGFGGVEGLARYLINERVDALIDATHPYAAIMSANAAAAAGPIEFVWSGSSPCGHEKAIAMASSVPTLRKSRLSRMDADPVEIRVLGCLIASAAASLSRAQRGAR